MRRVPLRTVPPADRRAEPGYREWHQPMYGLCSCCGERGSLERHHVVREQDVRREHGQPWDLRNSVMLGRWCPCHRDHHTGAHRLPASLLTVPNLEFMVELLGEHGAADYVVRHYRVG